VADLTQSIIHAIQGGLPLTPRPFALIAERLGTDEETVLDTVRDLRVQRGARYASPATAS